MVMESRSGSRRQPRTRDRAQLILIAAILIAAFVLSAVVLLNLLHESPEFSTQQDAKSVERVEELSDEFESDLFRFFMTHSPEEAEFTDSDSWEDEPEPGDRHAPFADSTEFSASIDLYDEAYTGTASHSEGTITSVSLANSDTGSAVWKTDNFARASNVDSDKFHEGYIDGEMVFLEDATALPRLVIDVRNVADDPVELTLNASVDGVEVLEIDDDTLRVGEKDATEEVCMPGDSDYRITIHHGTGEIRADGTYCEFDLDVPADEFNVTMNEASSDMEWWYQISGTDATVSDEYREADPDNPDILDRPTLFYAEDVLVDPVFDVTYTDTRLTYSSTIRLFDGDAR